MATRISTDAQVEVAKTEPPQTTRAKLRGDFIKAAQDKGKDISVDWVHLKMNDQTQRTVLCKDPFANVDERVERLIEAM
jgi:proteasome accessory factor A